MKWQLVRSITLIALLISAMAFFRPANANPTNPPAKITVEIPSNATRQEVSARVQLALAKLPPATTILSGSIDLSKMERVTVSLVENPSLESIADTRANPTSVTTPTELLTWNNSNSPTSYCAATPDQLKPTLTFSSPVSNTLRVYNWNNYLRNGEADHYDDISAYQAIVVGSGSVTMTMGIYHEIPGYQVEAYASAFLTRPEVYGYAAQSHYILDCLNRVYMPLAAVAP